MANACVDKIKELRTATQRVEARFGELDGGAAKPNPECCTRDEMKRYVDGEIGFRMSSVTHIREELTQLKDHVGKLSTAVQNVEKKAGPAPPKVEKGPAPKPNETELPSQFARQCEARFGRLEKELSVMEGHWRENLADTLKKCGSKTAPMDEALRKCEAKTAALDEAVRALKSNVTQLSGRDRAIQFDHEAFQRIHQEIGELRDDLGQVRSDVGRVTSDMGDVKGDLARQKKAIDVWFQFVGNLPKP
jgi:chromosome segregation ATPase